LRWPRSWTCNFFSILTEAAFECWFHVHLFGRVGLRPSASGSSNRWHDGSDRCAWERSDAQLRGAGRWSTPGAPSTKRLLGSTRSADALRACSQSCEGNRGVPLQHRSLTQTLALRPCFYLGRGRQVHPSPTLRSARPQTCARARHQPLATSPPCVLAAERGPRPRPSPRPGPPDGGVSAISGAPSAGVRSKKAVFEV